MVMDFYLGVRFEPQQFQTWLRQVTQILDFILNRQIIPQLLSYGMYLIRIPYITNCNYKLASTATTFWEGFVTHAISKSFLTILITFLSVLFIILSVAKNM